eukprot:m.92815 g.92815  ORF g.92815 m.92815 type:complete len:978 (+) comp9975_c0_seq2:72-3005(+)
METLKILHFNDVYNVEPQKREPVGGAARFVTKLRELRAKDPDKTLCCFSGDAFNPSLISTVSKGAQMVPCLNATGIDVALFGNHDFDFGQAHLAELVADCNFPWLMSNATSTLTGAKLGNGIEKMIIPIQGRRLGFIGLIEQEWLVTLATIDTEDVEYEDFVTAGLRLAEELREKDKVDLVIALTHMRLPNDERLARMCEGRIDLILGGHDHSYFTRVLAGVQIVKSGCDFKDLSEITIQFWPDDESDDSGDDPTNAVSRATFEVEHHRITSNIVQDPEVKAIVDGFLDDMKVKLGQSIGATAVSLDARFASVRTHETNIGNFITDAILDACQVGLHFADCVIMNSGTMRADRIFPPGNLTFFDLQTTLPLMDELCVVGLTGEQLIAALENGVSKWPALEGRFPQVAGIRFLFDSAKPPGQRIVQSTVEVGGAPLDPTRMYNVAAKSFVGKSGKDGYSVFLKGKLLVDEEDLPPVPTIVVNRFNVLRMINELDAEEDSEGLTMDKLDHNRTPCRRESALKFRRTLRSYPPLSPSGGGSASTSPPSSRYKAGGGRLSPLESRSKSVGGSPNSARGVHDADMDGGDVNDVNNNHDDAHSPDAVSPTPSTSSVFSDHPSSPRLSGYEPGGNKGPRLLGPPQSSVSSNSSPTIRFSIDPGVEGRIRCTSTEIWSIQEAMDVYDGFVLDQYGVLHNGGNPLPGVVDCLERMLAAGKRLCINSNTSKSPEDTRKNLVERHGLHVLSSVPIVTSGGLIRRALEESWKGKCCLLFGWGYSRPDLDGLDLTFTADPSEADFLVAGGPAGVTDADGNVLVATDFETTGNLSTLDPLMRSAVRRGLPMLVANNDRISRTADGGTAYRPGVIADRYDEFGGTTIRFGKPGLPIFQESIACMAEQGVVDTTRICHVGDSLHHDVAGATAAGLASIFVTGGVHAEALGIVPGETPSAPAMSVLCAENQVWPTRPVAAFAWTKSVQHKITFS